MEEKKWEIVRKFRREEEESWLDFKYRVIKSVQEILEELEDRWLEEEGGRGWTAGANVFSEFQIYLPCGKIRDIAVDLIFPDEATIKISEPREPTREEKEYFKELAETYCVAEDYKF